MNTHGLRPFFCYFGGKWRAAAHYPRPTYPQIIEPFAGASGYSLRYAHLQVALYDLNPIICGIWEYLIHVSAAEILRLPLQVAHVDEIFVCQEAKWLIGFWLNKASVSPRKSPSAWMRAGTRPHSYWGETIRQRLATQVDQIRHWTIAHHSYEQIPNQAATWFIDPPYHNRAGQLYGEHVDDYPSVATWCQERQGQVITCEQAGATWLPFKAFLTIKANPSKYGKAYSSEWMWTQEDQQELCDQNLLIAPGGQLELFP